MKDFGIRKTVDLPFEEAVSKATRELQAQGFGILSEIDMSAKLKEKLGVDIDRYLILGACNPPLAYRALQAEQEIGLLLPCNVIVYESGPGRSTVSAIDPDSMMAMAGDSGELRQIAKEARERLEKVIEAL